MLHSKHSVRVIEHGLQLEDRIYGANGSPYVPSSHRYGHSDTAYFSPITTGWDTTGGLVTAGWSIEIFAPSGKVLSKAGTGNKRVVRLPEFEARNIPFAIPLAGLDTSVDYYNVKWTRTDKVNGKSIKGLYRIYLK
jgi:hypothetical protein